MLRARVSESTVNALARRTSRLIEMIERATQRSPEKHVREGGSQLVELLSERLEEIREMHSIEDDDLIDRVRGFDLRIRLAEAKVLEWPQIKPRRNKPAAKTAKRPQKKTVRSAA
jgi:hypothetical protein